jgi:peroxiredoxin
MSKGQLTRRFLFSAICVFLCIFVNPVHGSEEKSAPKAVSAGMKLPQFTLDVPSSEKEQQYLGLKNPKPFSLSEISAKLIVIEIFSVYCPHCRKQAPQLNKLYKLIQQDPKLSQDIKMIAVAAGADQSKTDKWKETFHIPFPVLADQDTEIWKKFGQPGVPYTLVVSTCGTVLSDHAGATEDVEELFRHIKKLNEQK